MSPSILPRNPKVRKPSAVSAVMHSRRKTLELLYVRRAALENLIRSLEMYERAAHMASAKVVTLR